MDWWNENLIRAHDIIMKIGCSINSDEGIDHAIYSAIEIGANAIQISVSPLDSSAPGPPVRNHKELQEILKNTGIYVVIHGKYIINFCRKSVRWQHQGLLVDLRKANKLGPDVGVVLHQGKNVPKRLPPRLIYSVLTLNRQK